MSKEYWTEFYSKRKAPESPTLFATYLMDNYLKGDELLLELGCGNGRDSLFFAASGLNVVGVDLCEQEVVRLNSDNGLSNVTFVADSMASFPEAKYDVIYSRFSLHAVPEEVENEVFKRAACNLKEGGLLAIEVRSVNDSLYGVGTPAGNNAFITTHYRRFADFKTLKSKLSYLDYRIIEAHEARGFAPYNEEDPVVIRVIATT